MFWTLKIKKQKKVRASFSGITRNLPIKNGFFKNMERESFSSDHF